MQSFQIISSGAVTAAKGFQACGIAAGIKDGREDMALLVSDVEASAAGVFTTNAVQAAPVRLDRERVARGRARAIVINSGNANACTGEQGLADARAMTARVARGLHLPVEQVLVCSTGVIGVPLPMAVVLPGIDRAVAALSPDGGDAAAQAIMTTDAVDKQHAVAFELNGHTVTLGGMAKGAGMIEPNMATMLALMTTDAAIAPDCLQPLLRDVTDETFNRISVDGDRSTNDTVLILANGMSGAPALHPGHDAWPRFRDALQTVCLTLARMIVRDGEGATKCVTLRIQGAASANDAQRAARAIANSALVKTSWFGADPNWGRVIAALGYSGAHMDETRTRIAYDGLTAYANGQGMDRARRAELVQVLRKPEFELCVDLGSGSETCVFHTCDLTLDYVKINADYTT